MADSDKLLDAFKEDGLLDFLSMKDMYKFILSSCFRCVRYSSIWFFKECKTVSLTDIVGICIGRGSCSTFTVSDKWKVHYAPSAEPQKLSHNTFYIAGDLYTVEINYSVHTFNNSHIYFTLIIFDKLSYLIYIYISENVLGW